MALPEVVPVLKPQDFVIGPYECEDRLCLVGWKNRFFRWGPTGQKAYEVLMQCCDDAGVPTITSSEEPDTPSNRRQAAKIWRELLKRMGYTKDGPAMDL